MEIQLGVKLMNLNLATITQLANLALALLLFLLLHAKNNAPLDTMLHGKMISVMLAKYIMLRASLQLFKLKL